MKLKDTLEPTDTKRQGFQEPGAQTDEIAYRVIGAAIEVHKVLGPGFAEAVYEDALALEMRFRGIPFERQYQATVQYKGHDLRQVRLDMLAGGLVVVELKAVDTLAPVHTAQVISYLKALHLTVGLLINFNVPLLKSGIRRIVLSPALADRSITYPGHPALP